jgi:hypothetical protein
LLLERDLDLDLDLDLDRLRLRPARIMRAMARSRSLMEEKFLQCPVRGLLY